MPSQLRPNNAYLFSTLDNLQLRENHVLAEAFRNFVRTILSNVVRFKHTSAELNCIMCRFQRVRSPIDLRYNASLIAPIENL